MNITEDNVCDLLREGFQGDSALHFKDLLKKCDRLMTARNVDWWSVLHGKPAELEDKENHILTNECFLNWMKRNPLDEEHNTILHHACKHGMTNIAKHLIKLATEPGSGNHVDPTESLVDINAKNIYGESPLHLCCKRGDERSSIEILKALLACNGLDVNAETNKGKTALHLCCFHVDSRPFIESLQCLLKCEDLDVNAKTRDHGHTAMHLICEIPSDETPEPILKLLLQRDTEFKHMVNNAKYQKLEINATNKSGHTAFQNVCYRCLSEPYMYKILDLLLEMPDLNVNATIVPEESVLYLVCLEGDEKLLKKLLAKANLNLNAKLPETPRFCRDDSSSEIIRKAKIRKCLKLINDENVSRTRLW